MESSNAKEIIAMGLDPLKPKKKRLKPETSEKMENVVVEPSLIKTEFNDGEKESYEMQYDQNELETHQIDYESKEFDLEQGDLLEGIVNWSGTALVFLLYFNLKHKTVFTNNVGHFHSENIHGKHFT